MMSGIGDWVKGIAGAAVVCGAALAITPMSKVKEVLKILCGVLLIIALISPFPDNDFEAFSMDLARYRVQADSITGSAEKEQTNLSRSIIERELNTYILDKAQTLGIEDLVSSIVLKWGDEGYWYPYEVSLITDAGAAGKNALSSYIEGELGIPETRQYWSNHEEEVTQDES